MRVARLFQRSFARPRIALERDGALYDVEALEVALGAALEVGADPSDFHARAIALSCAGLVELDRALLTGRRPATSRVHPDAAARLAPCDTARASYVHVDTRASRPFVRVGHAPSLAGPGALIDLPADETRPDVEVGIAVVISEDLERPTRREVDAAILGYALLLDWIGHDQESARAGFGTARGLRAQLGPELIVGINARLLLAAPLTLRVAARAHDLGSFSKLALDPAAAVQLAASTVALRAGDVVGVGPLASARALGAELAPHDAVALEAEHFGVLAGAAVPRRDP